MRPCSNLSTLAIVALSAVVLLATPTRAQDPHAAADDSWISLTGTVAETDRESFRLDYGEGLITVEMDDGDWYGEAAGVLQGDRVTVSGRIDDDFLEQRTIEASSVYVKGLSRYYYASDADEEGALVSHPVQFPVDPGVGDAGWLTVTGTVEAIDGREFTLGRDTAVLRVDTIAMPYNPLDDVGPQQIVVGDRVSVSGRLDLDLFESTELLATSVISLEQNGD